MKRNKSKLTIITTLCGMKRNLSKLTIITTLCWMKRNPSKLTIFSLKYLFVNADPLSVMSRESVPRGWKVGKWNNMTYCRGAEKVPGDLAGNCVESREKRKVRWKHCGVFEKSITALGYIYEYWRGVFND